MNVSRKSFLTRRTGGGQRLFISYRRRFDAPSARLLKDALMEAFGEGAVFRDVDDIAPGEAFPESISEAVESCDVFLPLISPRWLEVIGELHDPADFVRREITAALARPVPLIPVLLGGARMPEPDELPGELKELASRQAVELSDTRWDYDVQRLVGVIRSLAARPATDSSADKLAAAFRSSLGTRVGKAAVVAAAVLLAAAAYAVFQYRAANVTNDDRKIPPTPTPLLSYVDCLNNLRVPGTHEAAVLAGDNNTPAEGTPVIWVDQYKRVSPPPPEGVPILIRLTEPVAHGDRGAVWDIGAVSLVFLKGDYPKGGVAFRVSKVVNVDPPCAEVTDYSNMDSKSKSEVYNWDSLSIRLRGRDYRLRLGDHGDSVLATLTRKAEK